MQTNGFLPWVSLLDHGMTFIRADIRELSSSCRGRKHPRPWPLAYDLGRKGRDEGLKSGLQTAIYTCTLLSNSAYFCSRSLWSSPRCSSITCVVFIEQNFGPYIAQNLASLYLSSCSVSSCIARAVSVSSESSNCLFQSKRKRAYDSASSRSRAPGRWRATSAAWAAIL